MMNINQRFYCVKSPEELGDLIKQLYNLSMKINKKSGQPVKKVVNPINIFIYGKPGCGKTHVAIQAAQEIIQEYDIASRPIPSDLQEKILLYGLDLSQPNVLACNPYMNIDSLVGPIDGSEVIKNNHIKRFVGGGILRSFIDGSPVILDDIHTLPEHSLSSLLPMLTSTKFCMEGFCYTANYPIFLICTSNLPMKELIKNPTIAEALLDRFIVVEYDATPPLSVVASELAGKTINIAGVDYQIDFLYDVLTGSVESRISPRKAITIVNLMLENPELCVLFGIDFMQLQQTLEESYRKNTELKHNLTIALLLAVSTQIQNILSTSYSLSEREAYALVKELAKAASDSEDYSKLIGENPTKEQVATILAAIVSKAIKEGALDDIKSDEKISELTEYTKPGKFLERVQLPEIILDE